MAAAIPFAMKAAPWIAGGIGSLIGKKLSGPSKEQKGAMAGTQQAATQAGQAVSPLLAGGAGLSREGARNLEPAGDYYRNILGSRQAANQALTPETTTALEYYRGAEGKTRRTMKGGGRDYALAELDRQKVGQLAGMLPAARRGAAEGAANVGQTYGQMGAAMTGQGLGAAQTSGYLNTGLFNQASGIRQQQQEGGKVWGGLLHDIVSSMPWGKSGGGGGGGGIPPYADVARAGATLPSVTQNPFQRYSGTGI